jgi:hypothetical protein
LLRFTRRAKGSASLREIGEPLSLRVDPSTTCADVRAMARAAIEDTTAGSRSFTEWRRLRLAQRGKGPTSECPILDILEERERRADR